MSNQYIIRINENERMKTTYSSLSDAEAEYMQIIGRQFMDLQDNIKSVNDVSLVETLELFLYKSDTNDRELIYWHYLKDMQRGV